MTNPTYRFTDAARQARRHAERRRIEQSLTSDVVELWRDFFAPLEAEPPAAAADAAEDRAELLLDERDRLRRLR